MNLAESIAFLKKEGYKIVKEDNHYLVTSRDGIEIGCWVNWSRGRNFLWTPREIVKWARGFRDFRDSNAQPSLGKNVNQTEEDFKKQKHFCDEFNRLMRLKWNSAENH